MKDPQLTIKRGDRLRLWNGSHVTNNMTSDIGSTHVNITHDNSPYGIPVHRDCVVEVWRDGARLWPPEAVQGRLL